MYFGDGQQHVLRNTCFIHSCLTGLDDVVRINRKGAMTLNLFSFVQFHFHTSQKLKPMGSGSSKKLVLQVYNGGHGEMHFASGASPAAFVFCCISCASLVFLWRVWDAFPAICCRISGAAVVHLLLVSAQTCFSSRSLLLSCSSICRLHFLLDLHKVFFLLAFPNSPSFFRLLLPMPADSRWMAGKQDHFLVTAEAAQSKYPGFSR